MPGNYWVAFEIHAPTFIGTGMTSTSETLESYASTFGNNPEYYPSPQGEAFALRIEGAVVPEPMTTALFVFGAFLLKFITKRK